MLECRYNFFLPPPSGPTSSRSDRVTSYASRRQKLGPLYKLYKIDEMNDPIETLQVASKIADNVTLVASLIFFIWYFMKRESKREEFITGVVQKNTSATNRQTLGFLKLVEVLDKNNPHSGHTEKEEIKKIIREVESDLRNNI